MGRALLSHFISSRFITNAAKPAIILLVASCMSTNITNNQLSMYNPTTAHGAQPSYIEGMDISRHQGNIDWEQCTAARSGKAFVLIKATEGVTYQDPMFLDNVKHASDAGFQLGAYHFLRFGSSSPSAQMENFIAQVKVAASLHREPFIVALDIEEHQGADYTLVSSVTEASVQYLKSNGMQPYIYTRTSFWDLYVPETPDIVKACPLWIARWRASPPLPRELPKGWNKWTIWQYTDKGSVPGITGNVDLNRMIAG